MAKLGLYRERGENWIGEESFFYKINTLEDVMNIKMNPFRKFDNFRTLLKAKTEKIGKRLAKKIVTDFFKLLAKDMIEEGDVYVFPKMKFGYMKIGDIADENHKKYTYDIETDGAYYGVYLKLEKGINYKAYRFRFNQVNKQKIKKLVEDGKRY